MGERKVLNKYYPPDFDPSKIPRAVKPKNQQIAVRNMHPMQNTFLGIRIYRFYLKCTNCSAELTVKTDYVVDFVATRNFKAGQMEDEVSEETGDAMESLESKMGDSKREMDRMAALEEMKSRHASVSADDVLTSL